MPALALQLLFLIAAVTSHRSERDAAKNFQIAGCLEGREDFRRGVVAAKLSVIATSLFGSAPCSPFLLTVEVDNGAKGTVSIPDRENRA